MVAGRQLQNIELLQGKTTWTGSADFDPCECSQPTWATCTKPKRERERNMCQESASTLVLLSATSQKISQETIQSAQGISKKIHGMAFFFVFFELWLIFVPSKDLLVQLLVGGSRLGTASQLLESAEAEPAELFWLNLSRLAPMSDLYIYIISYIYIFNII